MTAAAGYAWVVVDERGVELATYEATGNTDADEMMFVHRLNRPDAPGHRALLVPLVRCPDLPAPGVAADRDVIGCGYYIPDVRDDEGLVDCPKCGIWFTPD
ncbi:hypothetical protein [Gordonia alkanivorans]|uniref:hypothetical protein n=1 Tax=Gordonia alkanivorans TaxID=84096 RepID=UPI0004BAE402|nr:hypothetical protein [Gordonia alkanivorans]